METTKKPIPEAVSVKETAQILDVCQMTIHRWIKSGYIKAYRVGPHLIRIPRSEISRLRSIRIEFVANCDRHFYPKV